MTPLNSTSDASHQYHKNALIGVSVLSIFGLPGNILVIILISQAKKKKSTMTYLLLSLAVADIVNLLGVDFITIWHFLEVRQHTKATLLSTTFPTKVVTIFTLTTLALERYDVIVESIKSRLNITRKKIVIGVAIAWLVGTIHCVLTVQMVEIGGKIGTAFYVLWFLLLLVYIVPLIIVLFCYLSILKVLYIDGKILGAKIINIAARMKEMKRLIRILIVITLVFLACNLPTVVIVIKWLSSSDSGMQGVLYLSATVLECLSSALNPYLYGLQSKKYRSQVKELFCRDAKDEEDEEVDEEDTAISAKDVEVSHVYNTKL